MTTLVTLRSPAGLAAVRPSWITESTGRVPVVTMVLPVAAVVVTVDAVPMKNRARFSVLTLSVSSVPE